jgi:ATP-dependent DNA ligase
VSVRKSRGALRPAGEGLTVKKMKEWVWVRSELVAEVEFVEWTPEGHLRHARFVGMQALIQVLRFVSFVCNENDPRVIDHMLIITA